jgi:hypothetical protein
LGFFGKKFAIFKLSNALSSEPAPFPRRVREILDASTPVNPIKWSPDLPEIELAIPSTLKDLPYLKLVIQSAIKNSYNPIRLVRVIVPSSELEQFRLALGGGVEGASLQVIDEERLLGNLWEICNKVAPLSRRGWLIQQVLKYLCVLTSESAGVLIMDSDTVLTTPRIWLDEGGTQLLMISYEYHLPYQLHFLKFKLVLNKSSGAPKSPRVSYVTHHQIMQPELLREMLGGDLNWEAGLRSWIGTIDFQTQSPACEYHCYGTYLALTRTDRYKLARWGNIAIQRSQFPGLSLNSSMGTFRNVCSISVHAYL